MAQIRLTRLPIIPVPDNITEAIAHGLIVDFWPWRFFATVQDYSFKHLFDIRLVQNYP